MSKYNKVNVVINGSYLMAESLSLSQVSEQKSKHVLGNGSPVDYLPGILKNEISISYYVEPGNEPNYSVVTGIKSNLITGASPTIINFGNVYVTGYLTNYSFSLESNKPIKAQVDYDIYTPLTGNIQLQQAGDWNNYNLLNSSGIAHYWSTLFSGLISNINILQMSYNFKPTLIPVYTLGNPFPVQVAIVEANEQITTLSESQYNINYSGNILSNMLTGAQYLVVNNISSNWNNSNTSQIVFPLTGMIYQNSKSDARLNELLLFNSSFNQSY